LPDQSLDGATEFVRTNARVEQRFDARRPARLKDHVDENGARGIQKGRLVPSCQHGIERDRGVVV
jgi:hypothetical protein